MREPGQHRAGPGPEPPDARPARGVRVVTATGPDVIEAQRRVGEAHEHDDLWRDGERR